MNSTVQNIVLGTKTLENCVQGASRREQLELCLQAFVVASGVTEYALEVQACAWKCIQTHRLYELQHKTENEFCDELKAQYRLEEALRSDQRKAAAQAKLLQFWSAPPADVLGDLLPPERGRTFLYRLSKLPSIVRGRKEALDLLRREVRIRQSKKFLMKVPYLLTSDINKVIEEHNKSGVTSNLAQQNEKGRHTLRQEIGPQTLPERNARRIRFQGCGQQRRLTQFDTKMKLYVQHTKHHAE